MNTERGKFVEKLTNPINSISVFGGSAPKPGESAYQQAKSIGRLLGESGYSVITGGYIGTMEAVSQGAFESGAHVVGITCDQIEAWRPILANQWVQEEIRCSTLLERIYALISQCDAAIALPGGSGTLAEISVMWNLIHINAIPVKPLIIMGEEWKVIISNLLSVFTLYYPEKNLPWLSFTSDTTEVVEILNQHFETGYRTGQHYI